MDDVSDIIYLTVRQNLLYRSLLTRCLGKPVHDPCQHKQVLGAESAPACGQADEHIRLGGIGPGRGQRLHRPVVAEEVDPVLLPRPHERHEGELPPGPGMEGVYHPDGSLLTGGSRCS